MRNEREIRENAYMGEHYEILHHKSGLDIYVYPKDLTTYYGLFATKYGSVDNHFRKKGEEAFTDVPDGIAHFLEHKMFENEDGVDTFLRFAQTGASANAFTGFRNTAYLFSCTENFYESLEILLDFVTKPYFTEETVQKEQGIIGQEIRMGEDDPGRALIFGMLKCLYENNPVRYEIAGTVESISHITSDLLYRCYHTFYNLGNMALCVCGRVEAEKVLEVADKMLPDRKPDFEVESVYREESEKVFQSRMTRRMQVAKPMFCIGIKDTCISEDPEERMKKSTAIGILCEVLFGKTSEFYNTLYDEGLISPSFDFWAEHNACFSFLSINGECDQPETIYDRFVSYVEEKIKTGLDPVSFERCRRVALASFMKGFDSTEEIASTLLITFAMEGADLFSYPDLIRMIDLPYMEQLMKQLFVPSHYAMMTLLPLEEEKEEEKA